MTEDSWGRKHEKQKRRGEEERRKGTQQKKNEETNRHPKRAGTDETMMVSDRRTWHRNTEKN